MVGINTTSFQVVGSERSFEVRQEKETVVMCFFLLRNVSILLHCKFSEKKPKKQTKKNPLLFLPVAHSG